MKIVLDPKICQKHHLTLPQTLFTLALRMGFTPEDHLSLINQEVIVEKGNQYFVTQHWSEVLDEILSDSQKEISDERLFNLADQIKELFPKGKMRDMYGRETPYYFRCNRTEIKNSLKRFFTYYGNISDEDILDATRRYVESFHENYACMRLAKYFIWKNETKLDEEGKGHITQISDLATFLENKEEVGVEVNNSEEWLSKLV